MLKKNPFLQGTLLLTGAGVITRIIGFFYRIFLSRIMGEEGMGIYQLLAPVTALTFSLTCSGIQTAISKYIASYHAKGQKSACLHVLITGLFLSMSLSVMTAIILLRYDTWIALHLLFEERCAPLVKIFALSIPFSSLHCCINGYYYGLKKAFLPSFTQLIEQIARVGSVFLIYVIACRREAQISLSVAMLGILIGEVCSTLISTAAIYAHFYRIVPLQQMALSHFVIHTREILQMAFPLSANRLILNGLQSIEAVYIPTKLVQYGMQTSEALSCYGVLTGMTLPLLLFPTALTSSISVLLLPYISEAQAQQNVAKIGNAIKKCVTYCLLLGSICCIFLLVFGDFLGQFLFGSRLAGSYIKMLSIVCPVLYLGSVLTSILHGLGKAFTAFLYNSICLIIRLLFVFLLIPYLGMPAYLLGIFVSQLLFTALMLRCLYRQKRPYAGRPSRL